MGEGDELSDDGVVRATITGGVVRAMFPRRA